MESIRTELEGDALARIASELPVDLLFLRQGVVGIGAIRHRHWIKTHGDVIRALRRAVCGSHIAKVSDERVVACEIVRRGIFEHDGGCFLLVAGEPVVPTTKTTNGNAYEWAEKMAAAWREMLEEHVAKKAGSKSTPSPAYLAERFDIDEVNLWMMAEEAGEVVRGCGKIGRWGYDHRHQVTGESGMKLLEAEIGDFLATVEIMIARGHFDPAGIDAAKLAKFERLEKWYEAEWTPEDSAIKGQ